MNQELTERMLRLEKRFKRARLFNLCLLASFILLSLFSFSTSEKFNLIRAKGIIIEDEQGRDRILIGAPIPQSKDRVRTDTSKVRKYWAPNFGSESNNYMKYYKDYKHDTDGMVVLNEEGFDRVLLGDRLADPNTGKKMFESAGITWNDKEGWELGGAGVNTGSDGKARGVVGLDDPKTGGEAIHMVALEDGTKAIVIGGALGRLVIGMNGEASDFLQNKYPFSGIKYFDETGKLTWEQNLRTHKKE